MYTLEYNAMDCHWLVLSNLGVIVERFGNKTQAEQYLDQSEALPLRYFDEQCDWDNGEVTLRLRVYFTESGGAAEIQRVRVTHRLSFERWQQVTSHARERYEGEFMRWLDADDDARKEWCELALEYFQAGASYDV